MPTQLFTVQNDQGLEVEFEWEGINDPTDADLEEIFAQASGGVVEEPGGLPSLPEFTPSEPGKGILETGLEIGTEAVKGAAEFAKRFDPFGPVKDIATLAFGGEVPEDKFAGALKTGVKRAEVGITKAGAFLAEEGKQIQDAPTIFETFLKASQTGMIDDTGRVTPLEEQRPETVKAVEQIGEVAGKLETQREERAVAAEEFGRRSRVKAAQIEEQLKNDPEFQSRVDPNQPWWSADNISVKLAETAPLTLSAVGATVLTGAITKNPFIAAATGGSIFGAVSAGDTMFEYEESVKKQAIEQGKDPKQAVERARDSIQEAAELAGIGEAALEFLPGVMFIKMSGLVGKQFTKQLISEVGEQKARGVFLEAVAKLRGLANRAPAIGKLALAEGAEEALQTFKDNAIAQWNWDPERELTEGGLESATIGGIFGAFMGAGVRVARGRAEVKERVPREGELTEEQLAKLGKRPEVAAEVTPKVAEKEVTPGVPVEKKPIAEEVKPKSAEESAAVFEEALRKQELGKDKEVVNKALDIRRQELISEIEKVQGKEAEPGDAERSAEVFIKAEEALQDVQNTVEVVKATPELDAEIAKQKIQSQVDELIKLKETAEKATGQNLSSFYNKAIKDVLADVPVDIKIETAITPGKSQVLSDVKKELDEIDAIKDNEALQAESLDKFISKRAEFIEKAKTEPGITIGEISERTQAIEREIGKAEQTRQSIVGKEGLKGQLKDLQAKFDAERVSKKAKKEAEPKVKELTPDTAIGKTTIQGAVNALIEGDLSVIPDIVAGVEKHGLKPMQDRINNLVVDKDLSPDVKAKLNEALGGVTQADIAKAVAEEKAVTKRTDKPLIQVSFDPQKHSLIPWMKIQGGLKSQGVDIADITKTSPGLIDAAGQDIEALHLQAIDAGFISEQSDLNDFREMLRQEIAGKKVFSTARDIEAEAQRLLEEEDNPVDPTFELTQTEGRTIKGRVPVQTADLFTKEGFNQALTSEEAKKPTGEEAVTPERGQQDIELFSFGGAILKAINSGKTPKGKQPSRRVIQVLAYAVRQGIDPVGVSDENLKTVGLNDAEIIEYRKHTQVSISSDIANRTFRTAHKDDVLDNITRGVDEFMGVISTRLANIDPSIRVFVRKYLFDSMLNTYRDTKAVQPFMDGFATLSPSDQFELSKHLMNGDRKKALPIMQRAGVPFNVTDKILQIIKSRAKNAGFEINTIEDYFPRIVNDVEGLLAHLRGTKNWSAIDEAIRKKEKSLPEGEKLTDEQRAEIADTLLRGFPVEGISLRDPFTDPTHRKKRKIEELNDKLTTYYMRSDKALMIYLRTMNSSIAKNEFFGKGRKKPIKGAPLFPGTPMDTKSDINKSIGELAVDLKKRGRLDGQQEKALKSILFSIFNPSRTSRAIRDIKTGIYLVTLSNPISAITQIADMAFSAHKSGYLRTVGAAATAAVDIFRRKGAKRSEVSMEDIGIEQIAAEIENEGELGWLTRNLNKIAEGLGFERTAADIRRKGALSKAMEVSGFSIVDRLGKTTVLNASLVRLRAMARQGNIDRIKEIFGNNKKDYQPVIDDLLAEKNTDNVMFLLFNELSDVQPISIAEVPEMYLRSDKGKLFYALKTFQIKLLDVYRNDIYNEYRKGNKQKAINNLVRLTTSLALMNAGADELKDFLLGRKTDWTDRVIDNILRLGGLSKFTIWKARREGIFSAFVTLITPPLGMINDVSRDIGLLYETIIQSETISGIGKDARLEREANAKKGFRLPKYVPLAGKLYYWWFGNGKSLNEKALDKYYHDKLAQARVDGNSEAYKKLRKKARELDIKISKTKLKNRVKKLRR